MSLYSGDSKYTLISFIVIMISLMNYLSVKKYFILVMIFTCFSISILGFKKIYRDLFFDGGMDKLNYTYDDKDTTYVTQRPYEKKTIDNSYFFNEKIEYLFFDKSYFFSNHCGAINYSKFKNKQDKIIKNYVSKIKFNSSKPKSSIDYQIESKINNYCYLFFRVINRIDLLTQLSQAHYLIRYNNNTNGLSYKSILYIPVPRFIFKNKPHDNADELWMRYIPKIKNPLDKNRTVISVNPFAEAYMNYGNNGLYMIVAIYFLIFLFFFLATNTRNIFILAISYSLVISIINTNLSAKQIIGGSYQLFVIYILLYFVFYFFKKTELFSKVFLK